eukprot:105530-Pelagomonas_calceolata.AAC.1
MLFNQQLGLCPSAEEWRSLHGKVAISRSASTQQRISAYWGKSEAIWHYTFAGQFLVAVLKNKDVGGLLLAFF